MITDWFLVNKIYPIYTCRKSLKNEVMSVKLGAGLEHSENNFGTPPDRPEFSGAVTTENKTKKQDKL